MSRTRLRKLELAYLRFNAARTLGDARPSEFQVARFGDVVATWDRARNDSYYNRIVGLTAAALGELDPVLHRYAEEGAVPRVVVDAEEASDALSEALTEHGFEPILTLSYLDAEPGTLELRPPSPFGEDTRIERWGPAHADRFLGLLGAEAPMLELRRQYYCTDHFRTYVALVEDEPAAWATMYVHDNMGTMANAMTYEAFQRRGLHQSLLRQRLDDAKRLGLEWVVTDVLPASTSGRNCERAGLDPLTTTTHWERR